MAWGKNGTPSTLGSTSADVEITDLTTNKSNVFLAHLDPSTTAEHLLTFNDTGSSLYSRRYSGDGAGDATNISQSSISMRWFNNTDHFHMGYVNWISGEEKLALAWTIGQGAVGAGTAPHRYEWAFKYVPSPLTEEFTEIKFNTNSSNTWAIGTNLSVLGSDLTPAPAVAVKIQDGAVFYETDTNKSYVLYSGSWSEL